MDNSKFMDTSTTSEIYHILTSFLILIFFMFFYGLVASLTDLALFVSKKKMPNKAMIFFFWLVIVFVINLFRQIKLKFEYVVSNQILIGVGVFLIYFFYIFAHNASYVGLTVRKEAVIYETNKFTMAAIMYWILQFIIGAIVVLSVIRLFKFRNIESD